jgi:hypothetical protein
MNRIALVNGAIYLVEQMRSKLMIPDTQPNGNVKINSIRERGCVRHGAIFEMLPSLRAGRDIGRGVGRDGYETAILT